MLVALCGEVNPDTPPVTWEIAAEVLISLL